jgi:phenylalanyl-tRNA synthetase beta chain
MNILIPHHWLLEHLDTEANPAEIQKHLSLSGPSVERIYDREGESVYDIEVTTNRVDSMSVRGIAREAAVILQQAGIEARLKPLNLTNNLTPEVQTLPLPKITNDPQLCQRVMCIVLADVKRNPTPEWMARRLTQTDQNIHDSVIDITNYITHELGHPCHAFDYDKVMASGGEIIVKEAEPGKKFTTLDGEEYTTVGGEIVFESPSGEIIDLPAIKGTANTSINDETKNVLLWIENLDAKKVRFASMTHAIRTVAAQLSEKHVDPNLAETVIRRGIELYRDLCEARIASELYDDFPGQRQPTAVETQLERINAYLGIELPATTISSILTALGCEVVTENEHLTITPPTFRPDLTITADIIEEIARIYGYHNLPSVLMDTPIPLTKQEGVNFTFENQIKRYLSAIGWQEVYTYSMVSEELANQAAAPLNEHLKLSNPLTEDRVYLRRSLIPSLEEVFDQNPKTSKLSVFELANVYQPRPADLPHEDMRLSMISNRPFREVKGDLQALLKQFHLTNIDISPDAEVLLDYRQSGTIYVVSEEKSVFLGMIGITTAGRVAIDLEIGQLLSVARSHPTYEPIPKTPPTIEDLTFTLPERTSIGEVIKTIKAADTLVSAVELKASYHQNYTFSLTYWDKEQTLDAKKVEVIRQSIVNKVESGFNATLVGAV